MRLFSLNLPFLPTMRVYRIGERLVKAVCIPTHNKRISFPESHSWGIDKKELGSSKHFEVIIKNPEKYKPLLSNGIFLVFKEFGRSLDDVFPFTAAQTYCM